MLRRGNWCVPSQKLGIPTTLRRSCITSAGPVVIGQNLTWQLQLFFGDLRVWALLSLYSFKLHRLLNYWGGLLDIRVDLLR